jgi:hypothetical protein
MEPQVHFLINDSTLVDFILGQVVSVYTFVFKIHFNIIILHWGFPTTIFACFLSLSCMLYALHISSLIW